MNGSHHSSLSDINGICRLCLNRGGAQSIFDSEDNALNYSEKLTFLCASIKVKLWSI